MTGSPACWAAFGRILAAEYRDPERWAGHAFTVDAYAVQHPGEGSREAVRSVGVHLVSLHFTLERGMDPGLMARVRQGAAERLGESLPRLDPPADPGTCTVRDLLTGPGLQTPLPDAAEHARRSREWAEEAWRSWSDHHEAVARWADWLVAASPPGFPQGGVKR
jgi:hypothetical protein